MNGKRILLGVAVLLVLGAGYYFYGGHATPRGQQPLVSFSHGDVTLLKNTFNGSASSVRVLLLLSPT